LSCNWCGGQQALAGPARRCPECGGAHWACPYCKAALISDNKRFCSECGQSRPDAQALDATRAPYIAVLKARVDVNVVDLHAPNDGFCMRAVEGFWAAGRVVLGGACDVLLAPGATEMLGDAAFERVQRVNSDVRGLTSLTVNARGFVFAGSADGVLAWSAHTGQLAASALRGTTALAVPLCVADGQDTLVWAAVRGANGTSELVRLRFHALECLDGGSFEILERTPVDAQLRAVAPGADCQDAVTELWMLHEREHLGFEWGALKVPNGAVERERTPSLRKLPRAPGTRLKLVRLADGKFYLLGRSGQMTDDGAWLVTDGVEKGGAREIERSAGTWNPEPPAVLYEPAQQGGPFARERALDGTWVRVGNGKDAVRWSWCAVGDDAVAFKPEPTHGYWDGDALRARLGFLPGPHAAGPVVATPWGVATCALNGRELALIYLDFERAE
jgi:hypothetical protein